MFLDPGKKYLSIVKLEIANSLLDDWKLLMLLLNDFFLGTLTEILYVGGIQECSKKFNVTQLFYEHK